LSCLICCLFLDSPGFVSSDARLCTCRQKDIISSLCRMASSCRIPTRSCANSARSDVVVRLAAVRIVDRQMSRECARPRRALGWFVGLQDLDALRAMPTLQYPHDLSDPPPPPAAHAVPAHHGMPGYGFHFGHWSGFVRLLVCRKRGHWSYVCWITACAF
jgi:hypothetical protein